MVHVISDFMGKTFQAVQLTHEILLTIDHSCKISFISATLNFHRPLVCRMVGELGVMTSEPIVGVVFDRPVEGKTTISYICLPLNSPTQASQLTRTWSYYRLSLPLNHLP